MEFWFTATKYLPMAEPLCALSILSVMNTSPSPSCSIEGVLQNAILSPKPENILSKKLVGTACQAVPTNFFRELIFWISILQ